MKDQARGFKFIPLYSHFCFASLPVRIEDKEDFLDKNIQNFSNPRSSSLFAQTRAREIGKDGDSRMDKRIGAQVEEESEPEIGK